MLAANVMAGGLRPCTASALLSSSDVPERITVTPLRPALCTRPSMVWAAVEFEKRHACEVDDQHPVRIRDTVEHGADGGRRAEEEGAGNPVDDDVGVARPRLVIGPAVTIGRVRLVLFDEGCVMLDRRRLRHAMDEQHGAQGEADDDGLRQVAEDGEEERHAQHRRIAARGLQQASRPPASRSCSRRRRRARRQGRRAGCSSRAAPPPG